jgi:Lrp/AsnC family transcriptional regulator, regulator for asnA, asnC and gidA
MFGSHRGAGGSIGENRLFFLESGSTIATLVAAMRVARAFRGTAMVSPRYHHDEIPLMILGLAALLFRSSSVDMSGVDSIVLDKTNRKILEVLTRDARISYADLARVVDRAESTVRERVGALERRGVIHGYQAVVDPIEVGLSARGIVRGSFDLRNIKEIERALHSVPQVRRVVLSTGAHPLIIEIAAQDLVDFEHILEERLAPLELTNVETDLFVREIIPERPVLPGSSVPPAVRAIETTPSKQPVSPLQRGVATVGAGTV